MTEGNPSGCLEGGKEGRERGGEEKEKKMKNAIIFVPLTSTRPLVTREEGRGGKKRERLRKELALFGGLNWCEGDDSSS